MCCKLRVAGLELLEVSVVVFLLQGYVVSGQEVSSTASLTVYTFLPQRLTQMWHPSWVVSTYLSTHRL